MNIQDKCEIMMMKTLRSQIILRYVFCDLLVPFQTYILMRATPHRHTVEL